MTATVLVVDDSEDIRYTMKEICSHANWDVVEASTGKKAVDVFRILKPDIVLVDYHMPDWDGLMTTKEIRKQDCNIPIIVLTVDERQEIADAFLKAGATDFALKPIKAPDLISRIRINLKISELTKPKQSAFVEKGINETTLRSIKQFLLAQQYPVTIHEIQNNLPIAYQTVHRYLTYLETEGIVQSIPEYGKTGRPRNRYQLC